MTVKTKSDGSLFDEFFRLKHEIIKKYGVEPRGDIKNATAEKMLIEQAYLKGYVDGKAEAMQWIPCSERLPDGEGRDWVLAQVQEDNGFLWIPQVMEYRKDKKDDWYDTEEFGGWLKERHGDAFKVIAWMPLPEPYKEGE